MSTHDLTSTPRARDDDRVPHRSDRLIGSNIARLLRQRGDRVRALVRRPAGEDAVALRELGIELVPGDITDPDSVLAAAQGADAVVHSAAMLGGPTQSMEEGFAVNVLGSQNVF